jgi:Domain of unknown function (DUF4326)
MNVGRIRTGNRRDDAPEGVKPELDEMPYSIDRGSPLGNPYRITASMTRNQAIAYFRQDLERDIREKGPMYHQLRFIAERLREGHDIILMCWCAPRRCHGDAIIEQVNRLVREMEREIIKKPK